MFDGFLTCTRPILVSSINFRLKNRRVVGKKFGFLQNTLPRNVITVKKEFFRYHNGVTEEMIVFISLLVICFSNRFFKFPNSQIPFFAFKKLGYHA